MVHGNAVRVRLAGHKHRRLCRWLLQSTVAAVHLRRRRRTSAASSRVRDENVGEAFAQRLLLRRVEHVPCRRRESKARIYVRLERRSEGRRRASAVAAVARVGAEPRRIEAGVFRADHRRWRCSCRVRVKQLVAAGVEFGRPGVLEAAA